MRHFDVQMIGGVALHQGRIAEMRTGEGKTLVATLPLFLNGLTGRGVHVITVNDYLASRDAEWMGKIHTFLGLTVGCIQNDMDDVQRKEAYACSITYGTNNDFGLAAMYATARLLRLADGPDEVHRNQLAKLELRRHADKGPIEPQHAYAPSWWDA